MTFMVFTNFPARAQPLNDGRRFYCIPDSTACRSSLARGFTLGLLIALADLLRFVALSALPWGRLSELHYTAIAQETTCSRICIKPN